MRAMVLAGLLSACSFSAGVISDPPCTRIAPTVDAVAAGTYGFAGGGVVLLGRDERPDHDDDEPFPRWIFTAIGVVMLAVATGYALSAYYGFDHAGECR